MQAAPPLADDLRVDVCIVGGGFTGLWTALEIKTREPAAEVAIIEKDVCGGGASGRNGGFCMTWMSKAETLLKICGGQEGVRLLRESELAVKAIGSFCSEQDIDCQFRQDGWLWTASNESQNGAWDGTIEKLERFGLRPFESLDRQQIEQMSGCGRYTGGVFEPGVATLQPALLARGLRKVALKRGIRIFEGTPMIELMRDARPGVRTPSGSIRASSVVLALNAWAHELPEFRRTVLPIAADVISTKPVLDRLREIGLDDCKAVSDSRLLVNFYRTTTQGRMIWGVGGGGIPFGGRLGTKFDGASPRRDEVLTAMLRHYPTLAGVELETAWRGPATRTMSGLPFFGRLPSAQCIVYGHGYTGNGVGPCYLGGKILASLALGHQDEWSQSALARGPVPKRLPPEPARYLGGLAVRGACVRMERAQDAGNKPTWLDAKLASFAPSSLVPTKKPD